MPVPTSTSRRRFSSESGQGIVEYILLLVVVIGIAVAVSARLFKPFGDWAKNYMGDYIYCLLDQGELPSLGGEESVSDCDKDFAAYSFGEGRPGNGNGSGSEDGDGDSSEEKGGRERLGKNGSSGSGGVTGGGGANRGRARRSAGLGSGFDSDNGSRSGKVTDVTESMKNRRIVVRSGSRTTTISSDARVLRANGLSGMIAQEQERIKKREQKVTAVSRSSDRSVAFVRGKTKMMPVEIRSRKASELDLTAGDWSFGGIFRTLFIIAIIIALVLFIGGQMMQISKSMEKE